MTDLEFGIRFAEKDLPHRALLLYCLKSGAAQILYCAEDGILLREKNAGHFLLSAQNRGTAEKLLKITGNKDEIVAHEEFYNDLLQKMNPKTVIPCNIAAYLKKEPPAASDADIRQLTIADLPTVIEHYHLFTDEEYFAERLNSGAMYGIYVEDKPAGFIGQHDSGEMGLLEIFEPFRRQGLGLKLEKYMIRKILNAGRMPVGEVIVGNTASLALQRKAGMEIDRTQTAAWWIF